MKKQVKFTNTDKRWIMERAWELRKSAHIDMSTALRAAWAIQRVLNMANREYRDPGYMVMPSRWVNYGKDRTYINVHVYGKKFSKINMGYVDDLTGIYYAA